MCFICVSKINALISAVKALSSSVLCQLIDMLAYFVDFYHTVIGGQGYSVTAVMCYD